jgi:hypothetical protein
MKILDKIRRIFSRPPLPHAQVRHDFSLARGAPLDEDFQRDNLPRTLDLRILRRLFS